MLIVPDVSKLESHGFHKRGVYHGRGLDIYEKYLTSVENPLDTSQTMRVSLVVNPVGYGRFPNDTMVLIVSGTDAEGSEVGEAIPLDPLMLQLFDGTVGWVDDRDCCACERRLIVAGEPIVVNMRLDEKLTGKRVMNLTLTPDEEELPF